MVRPESRRRWRLGSIGQEALLNVAADWPRSLILAVLLAAAMTVPAIGEAVTVDVNLELVSHIERGGGNVLVASPSEAAGGQARLDPRTCEALRESPSVLASGSVGDRFSRPIAGLGIREATVAPVSPGALDVMWPAHEWTQILDLVVPAEFATARGLYPGSRIHLGDRTAMVSAVFDATDRLPSGGTTILEVVSMTHRPAAECLVETTWEARSTLAGTLVAALSHDGTPPQVVPLRSGGVFARNPHEEHTHRWSKTAWVGASLAAGFLVLLVSLGRRAHVGLYRSLRMSRTETTLLLSLESIVVVGAALAVTVVAVGVWSYLGGLSATAFAYGVRSAALTAAGTTLAVGPAVSAATIGTVGNQLKER